MAKNARNSVNKIAVMREIILRGPINRAAIAKNLQLSLPYVMTMTEELTNLGRICSFGKGESSGGKRPEMLIPVGNSEYYMGVDIGSRAVRIIINNLAQEVVFATRENTGDVQPADQFIDRLCRLIQRCVLETRIDPEKLIGIGVAMPGLIEQNSGVVLFSPDFGWNDVPLQSMMRDCLPFTVLVENSNRALALAECGWTGENSESSQRTRLCVNLGHGIGGALLVDGRLHYGSSGTSGEIGHVTVCSDGNFCACGNRGCLEAMASGAAIARQGTEAVLLDVPTKIKELCGNDLGKLDAKIVFDAAKLRDEVAVSIISKAADYIGLVLSMMINVLDPESIILCGGLTKNGDEFLQAIKSSVRRRQMRQAGRSVKIVYGTKGDYGTAIGASYLIPYHGEVVPKLKHYYYE